MNNQQPFTGIVFPQIIAGGGGGLFLFSHKKGGDYLREGDNLREAIVPVYFKYCSLEVVS